MHSLTLPKSFSFERIKQNNHIEWGGYRVPLPACRFVCKKYVQMTTFGGYFKQNISLMLIYPIPPFIFYCSFHLFHHPNFTVRTCVHAYAWLRTWTRKYMVFNKHGLNLKQTLNILYSLSHERPSISCTLPSCQFDVLIHSRKLEDTSSLIYGDVLYWCIDGSCRSYISIQPSMCKRLKHISEDKITVLGSICCFYD